MLLHMDGWRVLHIGRYCAVILDYDFVFLDVNVKVSVKLKEEIITF